MEQLARQTPYAPPSNLWTGPPLSQSLAATCKSLPSGPFPQRRRLSAGFRLKIDGHPGWNGSLSVCEK